MKISKRISKFLCMGMVCALAFTTLMPSISYAKVNVQAPKLKTVKMENNKAFVIWSRPEKATGYQVYRAVKNGNKTGKYVRVKTVKGLKNTTFKDVKVKPLTSYSYKVRSYRVINKKTYFSNFSNVKTVATKLAAPKMTNYTYTIKTTTVAWSGNKNIDGYQIYHSLGKNNKFSKVKTVSSEENSCVFSNLELNTTHNFKIRSYKKINGKMVYSPFSNILKVRLPEKIDAAYEFDFDSSVSGIEEENLEIAGCFFTNNNDTGITINKTGLVADCSNKDYDRELELRAWAYEDGEDFYEESSVYIPPHESRWLMFHVVGTPTHYDGFSTILMSATWEDEPYVILSSDIRGNWFMALYDGDITQLGDMGREDIPVVYDEIPFDDRCNW